MRLGLACVSAAAAALLVGAAPGGASAHVRPVPILEYHAIGTAPHGARYPRLYVPARTLRAQVGWLAARGWQAVTLDRVLRAWRGRGSLPRKPVVLTFDDGYPGDVDVALPVLRARGWRGVLNLQIGNLVPARVRKLIAAGWEIDVHTFTHPNLTKAGPKRLRREVDGARRWVRAVFHVRADAFAYPSGRYDAAVVRAVRRAGFAAAETERPGWASPRQGMLTLDRLEVTAATGVTGLASMLR